MPIKAEKQSRRPNLTLVWVVLIVAAMLALSLLRPIASQLFHFGPLHPEDLAMAAAFFLGLLVLLEALKTYLTRYLEF